MTRQTATLVLFLSLTLSIPAELHDNRILSDPQNAAYWYQKAFVLFDDPNDIKEYALGQTALTPEIELYLREHKPVLEHLAKAARSDYCDWGFNPLENIEEVAPYLFPADKVSYLLSANIRATRDKNPATLPLQEIETLLKLSVHIDSNDPLNQSVALSIRARVHPLLVDLLNNAPNAELTDLLALKTALAQELNFRQSLKNALDYKIQEAKIVMSNPDQYFGQASPSLSYYGFLNNRSDEFYNNNFTYHANHLMHIREAIDMPYSQAYPELHRIEESTSEKFRELRDRLPLLPGGKQFSAEDNAYLDSCDFLYTALLRPVNPYFYTSKIKVMTEYNALRTALDIMIEYRSSHSIAEVTPADSPKDLFSDEPFLLLRTEDGFVLKCRGRDLRQDQTHAYRFNLPKL